MYHKVIHLYKLKSQNVKSIHKTLIFNYDIINLKRNDGQAHDI